MFPMMNNNFFNSFIQFMNQNKGQNPNDMINNIITSGRISQQQLNEAQAKAQQMAGMFEQFRGMFGL